MFSDLSRVVLPLQWFSSVDEDGKRYFYKEGGDESAWQLPQVNGWGMGKGLQVPQRGRTLGVVGYLSGRQGPQYKSAVQGRGMGQGTPGLRLAGGGTPGIMGEVWTPGSTEGRMPPPRY